MFGFLTVILFDVRSVRRIVALRTQMVHTQIPPQKTDGLLSCLKLCFCAGERRGEQNTHGSDKKTHATKALKMSVYWHFWCLLFVPANPAAKKVPKVTSQSPSGTTPGTRQEGKIGLRFALGAFQGRFWTPKWAPNGAQNRSKIDLGAQERPRAAGRPKKTPPETRI